MLAAAGTSQATIVGFGQLGGNNTTVPSDLASNATADDDGYTVSNGTTPGIALAWDGAWDIHGQIDPAGWFDPLEQQTAGGGDWDLDANHAKIGQLDSGTHTIGFSADAGAALQLNSFDFGHTAETAGTTVWDLSLADSSNNVVWSEVVTFNNGQSLTISPNYTGAFGEGYTLTFERTSETYGSNGRHGIDNLSFSQVSVPEPSSVILGLLTVATVAGLSYRRR